MKTTGIEAFARIEIPADIGKNQLATLKCKVDTGAGGNVMPLCTFAKLFPERFDKDGNPTGLSPSSTRLTAYNGSPSSSLEPSRLTSTGHPKIDGSPNVSTHNGMLLIPLDQPYLNSPHAPNSTL